MSGGKSKTYGKAVPDHYTRSRHKECSKRGVPNKLSKKSLKNPLTNRSTYGIMNTSNERGKQDDF